MDKRGLKTSLVVSITVMCILCIYLIYYIVSQYDYSVSSSDNIKVAENNTNDVDILLLERYIDAFNNNCVDMKGIYSSKTLIKDIDSNLKLTTVLNMNNNYNKKYIEEEYRKIFNEDIKLDKVSGTCPKIVFDNGIVTKLNCTCQTNSGLVTHFIKSIKKNNDIKLFYKVAFHSTKKHLGIETKVFSKDSLGNEVIDSRTLSATVKEFDYQKYLDENYNDFYTYIYTFKYNDTDKNYYFYSISMDKKS